MKFNTQRFLQVMGIFAILDICLMTAACSTAWTTEATNIIVLLVPAIQAALAILAGFGVGLPATVMTAVNTWAAEAQKDLSIVRGLIEQYNSAAANAQPGILVEIENLLGVISSNLAAILPQIHVADATVEARILAVIQAIAGEISALLTLIPAVQGKVTSAAELKALVEKSGFKDPKHFKKDFNTAAGYFGKQFEI